MDELSTSFLTSNGSLYPQLLPNPLWRSYPLNGTDPGIHLQLLASNRFQMLFNKGNGNLSLAIPMISMLLQPNATIIPINCTYPLSGQYDVLPRFLFYMALIISLLFRQSFWVEAALSTAMTYSALTAIHFFVLLSKYNWKWDYGEGVLPWNSVDSIKFGDIDFFGIIPILSSAGVMLTPILMWSKKHRSSETRPVVILWGLLIFSALIPALILLRSFLRDQWGLNSPPSLAYCPWDKDPVCSWDSMTSKHGFTWEVYMKCSCLDFCGILAPTAPLRSSTTMIAKLQRHFSTKTQMKGRFRKFFIVIMAIWGFATCQGLLAILWSGKQPEEIRNYMFQFIYFDKRAIVNHFFKGERHAKMVHRWGLDKPERRNWWSTCRKYFAASIAAFFYLLAALGIVIYPLTFIVTIAINELLAAEYPVSEHSDAVGAWSPWAAVALVFVVALFVRFNHLLLSFTLAVLLWPANWFRYEKHERPSIMDSIREREDRIKQGKEEKEGPGKREGVLSAIAESWNSAGLRIREFRQWWRDPVEHSRGGIVSHGPVLETELGLYKEDKRTATDSIRLASIPEQ